MAENTYFSKVRGECRPAFITPACKVTAAGTTGSTLPPVFPLLQSATCACLIGKYDDRGETHGGIKKELVTVNQPIIEAAVCRDNTPQHMAERH
ncbi:hypothetical protein E2C01_074321 [Portunus trituberculatus]|uniref:Uncharacterized protein n=1 Tax=Portunus trituberculatus TaxID=210409 RepID=A0A5B7IGS4_PORTR|nr:hypothetical protein [Portunus trituberculatus]